MGKKRKWYATVSVTCTHGQDCHLQYQESAQIVRHCLAEGCPLHDIFSAKKTCMTRVVSTPPSKHEVEASHATIQEFHYKIRPQSSSVVESVVLLAPLTPYTLTIDIRNTTCVADVDCEDRWSQWCRNCVTQQLQPSACPTRSNHTPTRPTPANCDTV